jgi:4-amino-4-deoxy-L-arabinose transferase-like glycosyltransferase
MRAYDAPDRHALAAFLVTNGKGARYLVATSNARQAAPLIIATGAPVIPLGGFMGSMPVMTLPELIQLVDSGQLRFVLLDEGSQGAAARGRRFGRRPTELQQAIALWVHARGVPIDPSLWRLRQEPDAPAPRMMAEQLYDLRPQPPSQPEATPATAKTAAAP